MSLAGEQCSFIPRWSHRHGGGSSSSYFISKQCEKWRMWSPWVEIPLKPHQGACWYSGGVAKPDESAAPRLFADSGLPFIARKNIHQDLDSG